VAAKRNIPAYAGSTTVITSVKWPNKCVFVPVSIVTTEPVEYSPPQYFQHFALPFSVSGRPVSYTGVVPNS
jgi:hypothetical protein